jgi:hypothetical protein
LHEPGTLEATETGITMIPSIEEEQKQFRQKDIAQKPTQIFLEHCNQYAKTNLIKNEMMI